MVSFSLFGKKESTTERMNSTTRGSPENIFSIKERGMKQKRGRKRRECTTPQENWLGCAMKFKIQFLQFGSLSLAQLHQFQIATTIIIIYILLINDTVIVLLFILN